MKLFSGLDCSRTKSAHLVFICAVTLLYKKFFFLQQVKYFTKKTTMETLLKEEDISPKVENC